MFMALQVKGDILWGILVATVAALLLGVTELPDAVVAAPDLLQLLRTVPDGRTAAWPSLQIFTPVLLMAVFAIMLTDFFDTMGTVVAVGEQAGFVDPEGKVPGIRSILAVDSLAAIGGRTLRRELHHHLHRDRCRGGRGRAYRPHRDRGGHASSPSALSSRPSWRWSAAATPSPTPSSTSLLTESGFTAPEGSYYVYPITAGALIVVGFLMMRIVREIPWTDLEEAFPAFLTIVGIPLTYNISYGIGFGFISYILIKVFHGKAREVHPFFYVLSLAFAATFVLPWIQSLVD